MVEKLKELYNNIDVDYNKIYLYFKNCREKEDWYYNELIEIYTNNEDLSVDKAIEECHGLHEINSYTNESLNKIDNFIVNLENLLKNDNIKYNNFNYNSSNLIN